MADQDSPTLEPTLDQKLDTLDDHLEPVKNDEPTKPPEEPETPDETPAEGKEPTDGEAEPDAKAEGTDGESEEGYTIDGDEEDETEQPDTDTVVEQPKGKLDPEQQFIADGLNSMTVTGTLNGKNVSYDIMTTDQLPSGFKYDSDTVHDQAMRLTTVNEITARERQTEYRNEQTQKQSEQFKEREDTADRNDIGQLQREGKIAKFKLQPSDPKFDTDPAAELIQKVLDYKEQRNTKYMEEYNAGRPYKHIGFEEAFGMYQSANPTADPAQAKEDKERKELAGRTSSTRSTKGEDGTRPRITTGMTSRDLDNLIESLEF